MFILLTLTVLKFSFLNMLLIKFFKRMLSKNVAMTLQNPPIKPFISFLMPYQGTYNIVWPSVWLRYIKKINGMFVYK